ncbi:MAG TPA: hypothetical protein VH502_07020 [Actinoplanes sp.]
MLSNGDGPDTAPDQVTLHPVRHGDREIGAYVVGPQGVTFVPAVDSTAIALVALASATAMTIAASVAIAVRRRPAIGTVSMGPGGWVSLKRASTPPLEAATARPWWAHLLRAHRLIVQP